jgi:hypothetical protein
MFNCAVASISCPSGFKTTTVSKRSLQPRCFQPLGTGKSGWSISIWTPFLAIQKVSVTTNNSTCCICRLTFIQRTNRQCIEPGKSNVQVQDDQMIVSG